MRRVEQHVIEKEHPQYQAIDAMAFAAKNLYSTIASPATGRFFWGKTSCKSKQIRSIYFYKHHYNGYGSYSLPAGKKKIPEQCEQQEDAPNHEPEPFAFEYLAFKKHENTQ